MNLEVVGPASSILKRSSLFVIVIKNSCFAIFLGLLNEKLRAKSIASQAINKISGRALDQKRDVKECRVKISPDRARFSLHFALLVTPQDFRFPDNAYILMHQNCTDVIRSSITL